MWYWPLVPLVALAVLVVVHGVALRVAPGSAFMGRFWIAFAIGIAAEAGLDAAIASSAGGWAAWQETGLPNAVTFPALAFCYFQFFTLGETGRRMRLLMELWRSPAGLTEDELVGRYRGAEVATRRIERLIEWGQLVERDGRLYIGAPLMLRGAQMVVVLKRLVMGRDREPD